MSTFAAADYVVFIASVLISLSIGVLFAYRSRKRQTMDDYLLANRKMKVIPVAVSIAVSYESAITLLGFPAEVYQFGIVYIWFVVTFLLAFLILRKIFVPLLHPLKITSLFELRFRSRTPRLVVTVLAMLRAILYMSVVLFGPAIAIEAVTPFPYWSTILLAAVVAVIYTTIGGMKAVIWTDVFQLVVMTTGLIAVLLKSAMVSGGFSNVFVIASEQGRMNVDKFKLDLKVKTFWPLFFGGIVSHFDIIFSQTSYLRIKSVPTQKDANTVMLIAGVTMISFATLASVTGIFAFSYFHTLGCDPLASKRISNSNQAFLTHLIGFLVVLCVCLSSLRLSLIIPLMVAQIFADYPGVIGLFIAALFSATLSTLSSGFNSLAALTTEDFVKPYFKHLTESSIIKIAKMSVLVYGVIVVAAAFAIGNIKGSLVQVLISTSGSIQGPITGMFALAIFCPLANSKGSLIGALVGFIFVLWISLGQFLSPTLRREQPLPPASTLQCQSNSTITNMSSYTSGYDWVAPNTTVSGSMENSGLDNLYSLNYVMFPLVGASVTIIIASIASFMTGKPKNEDIDVKYMLPLVDHCCPYLPAQIKQYLYCGVDFYKTPDVAKQTEDQTHPFQPLERTSSFVKTAYNESSPGIGLLQQLKNQKDECNVQT